MPVITQITAQKRRPNRRSVFIDGDFAFGVSLNVVARFHLCDGLTLTDEQVLEIQRGQVRQECLDHALRYLAMRLHGRRELHQKLMRREYGPAVVEGVLDDLARLGYLDDDRFALDKAHAAGRRHVSQRGAMAELMRAGIKADVAARATAAAYEQVGPAAQARALVERQRPRLRKLDPQAAKRRLIGLLQRRGFDNGAICSAVESILGVADNDGFSTGEEI